SRRRHTRFSRDWSSDGALPILVVDAALAVPQQRVHFVPVSIGYERVIEAGEYQRELSGGEKQKEDARGLFKTPEILLHRYGRIKIGRASCRERVWHRHSDQGWT